MIIEEQKLLRLKNLKQWRAWLEANHSEEKEAYLVFTDTNLTYLEAVETAICFGWIDGVQKRISADERVQRFTPRRPRGNWTELNKERARRLIAIGEMTPAGLAVLPDLELLFKIPEELEKTLKSDPEVWQNFQSFPPLYQRIRIGNIIGLKADSPEYQTKVANLLKYTKQNKLFGDWNDGGKLLDYKIGKGRR